MQNFDDLATTRLSGCPSEPAPDGSAVRPLLAVAVGTMAHFELRAGQTSRAVAHRTVEEIWFVLAGRGELWRKRGSQENVVVLEPGVCATLPRGTWFQFRASPGESVEIIAATIPGWPGNDEAKFVPGPWSPSIDP